MIQLLPNYISERLENMPEYRKKLIEVALPLEAINKESAREKSIRHGHPSTLHLWWSRKPLATCRAVLFASLVDDPSSRPEEFPTEQDQERERLRLFKLMEELITWENSNNQEALAKAQAEIRRSTLGNPPNLLDFFCGGGSIPLEAQRLGLNVYASDLNPVAVLITKALVEIPPKFAGRPPVNPEAQRTLMGREWHGAQGLADDISYYGNWMRDEAERRIGHFYPKASLPKEYGSEEATVIAWLWVRTVTCPNPACNAQMPLTSEWWLSKKKGKEVWVEPMVDREAKTVNFEVRMGEPRGRSVNEIGTGTSFLGNQGKKTKATFRCIICRVGVARGDYIDKEANKGKMGVMPLAIVAEEKQGRIYLPVNNIQMQMIQDQILQQLSNQTIHEKVPTEPARGTFASNAQGRIYGFKTFADYFTPRQLLALITFSDLVQEVRGKVLTDSSTASLPSENVSLNNGGKGAIAYADAIATYLALAVDKGANLWSSLCSWMSDRGALRETFARQAHGLRNETRASERWMEKSHHSPF
jgi:putative DNA methylase